MKRICIALAVLGVATAAGCRSPVGTGGRREAGPTQMRERIAALSNAVLRLDGRMQALERQWDELQPSLEPAFFILEEMMNAPVVQESLIGVEE